MFYYKITGSIEINDYTEKIINRRNGVDERTVIETISDELFEKSGHKRFIFVSSVKYRGITMGLVSSDNSKIDSFIKSLSLNSRCRILNMKRSLSGCAIV